MATQKAQLLLPTVSLVCGLRQAIYILFTVSSPKQWVLLVEKVQHDKVPDSLCPEGGHANVLYSCRLNHAPFAHLKGFYYYY